MAKDDDKDKKPDFLGKAKMGIAIGSMVVGGISDAYKGKTPTSDRMAGDYQRSQDMWRRDKDKKK
jgi:hypothetical protein